MYLTIVRDNWESQKPELASKVASILGQTYTLEVNMNAVYAYATDGYAKDRPGDLTRSYFESFVNHIENYVKTYGDDGKSTFNSVVPTRKITLEVDEEGKVGYCGCDIKEGRFRILAGENYLGTNIYDSCSRIIKAVQDAEAASGGASLSVSAKANLKDTVEKEGPKLEQQLSEILGTKITLDANAEAIYAKMKTVSGFNDAQLGTAILAYFNGFVYCLEYLKFKGDEMMQEAFQDACSKNTIRMEVVDKLQNGTYNDAIFEDGVCKLQVSLRTSPWLT
jgi:hypothetical protein